MNPKYPVPIKALSGHVPHLHLLNPFRFRRLYECFKRTVLISRRNYLFRTPAFIPMHITWRSGSFFGLSFAARIFGPTTGALTSSLPTQGNFNAGKVCNLYNCDHCTARRILTGRDGGLHTPRVRLEFEFSEFTTFIFQHGCLAQRAPKVPASEGDREALFHQVSHRSWQLLNGLRFGTVSICQCL